VTLNHRDPHNPSLVSYDCDVQSCIEHIDIDTTKDSANAHGWTAEFRHNQWLHYCPVHSMTALVREDKPGMINHPPHYTAHPSGVECIQITEHYDFLLGNVIKYIWRADHKNGLEDLKKARFYLDRAISNREKK
jgi:hypothetical protein